MPDTTPDTTNTADTHTADIVVVGAGHNALITAAYLASAGLEVVVLEARDTIGGNTVTEELTLPGYRHDSCSSAHVLIQSNPVLGELELRRYGLRYVYPDPAVVMRLGDGSSLVMHRDADQTAAGIARRSPVDARAYLEMLAEWDAGLARSHARWNAGGAAEPRYAALRARSAWAVIHERFGDPAVRDFLLWLSFLTIQRPDRPGTGILPFAITAGRHRFGWAMPVGGSIALPQALARLVERHGGTVRTGRPVASILVEGGRARGVRCADGGVFAARRAVVTGAHLSQVGGMLADCQVPAELAAAQAAWRPGLTLFAVHLALRGPLRYPADGHTVESAAIESVAGGLGSAAGLRAQIAAFDRGDTDDTDPWLLLVCPGVVDSTRAPAGRTTGKLLTIAPPTLGGGRRWDDERDRFAAALVRRAAGAVGGLEPDDVLALRAECPPDLAERNPHNVGGSCHGGEFTDGRVGWPEYRLLPGLYQTGATAHPGGSVSGRPGRNTARRVLADLGIAPPVVMGDE